MYAVALTMTGKARTELAALRDRFGTSMNYSIEPHVTVKSPFTLTVDINVVEARLEEVARQTKPFWVVFDGVRYWEGANNVAYVAVRDRTPVFNLHVAIAQALRALAEGDTTYDLANFTPHMTIGERIPDSALPAVKAELATFRPRYRLKMSSFTLFAAEPNLTQETWKSARVFRFQPSR